MKTHTFSIVVGDTRCNARCKFCVSQSKKTETTEPDWDKFDIAVRIVEQARNGLVNVLLTGEGETLLFPGHITGYLWELQNRFPLVDLQTNGMLLPKMPLIKWKAMGLSLVCISIAHHYSVFSNDIMGTAGNFWDNVKLVKDSGLAVRLNCTLLKSGVGSVEELDELLFACRAHGVDQLTVRPVEMPYGVIPESVKKYIESERPGMGPLYNFIDRNGEKLLELPHGAAVYDVGGQNVCMGNCLTATTNPEDIRQVIYFPDGRICYDWRYPGARIL